MHQIDIFLVIKTKECLTWFGRTGFFSPHPLQLPIEGINSDKHCDRRLPIKKQLLICLRKWNLILETSQPVRKWNGEDQESQHAVLNFASCFLFWDPNFYHKIHTSLPLALYCALLVAWSASEDRGGIPNPCKHPFIWDKLSHLWVPFKIRTE